MDIGAGDGRVLKAIQAKLETRLRTIKCYAIEKAITHLNNMPKDITVVGTDFEQQTLVDKAVDIIFCNPPYSEFEQWMFRRS
jgi:tRNA1(Val) A37 N6-methylase TrmN6